MNYIDNLNNTNKEINKANNMVVKEEINKSPYAQELHKIDKLYGFDMMIYCRSNFSSILENPGVLLKILRENFNERSDLYTDLCINNRLPHFKNFIYTLYDPKIRAYIETIDDPFTLMKKAGYNLYECHTYKDTLKFKSYYAHKEEICTFDDPNRTNKNYVFFAVKENALDIKRSDKPQREDAYGTSVISIQFEKGMYNFISIKNRYNHTVENPDATFGNDLEEIIPGLTYSFINYLHLTLASSKDAVIMPGYVKSPEGKLYKYNLVTKDHVYYCPNNIIVTPEGTIDKYSKENNASYIVMDNYILDLINKKVICNENDAFVDSLQDIEKIDIVKMNDKSKTIKISMKDNKEAYLVINKNNQIVLYINENIKNIGDNFMRYNSTLMELNIKNVESFGDNCLNCVLDLKTVEFPYLKRVGNGFLENKIYVSNKNTVYMPNIEYIGDDCFRHTEFGHDFDNFYCPHLKKIGSHFAYRSNNFPKIDLPEVEEIGDYFIYSGSKNITDINLPKLKHVGDNFLINSKLINASFPNLITVGDCFMAQSTNLESIDIRNVTSVGDDALVDCNLLKNINLNSLETYGADFLFGSPKLRRNAIAKIMLRNIGNSLEPFNNNGYNK